MINPLSTLPGYALRRASSAMLADLAKRLLPLELSTIETSIIVLIEANPGITQSDLCRSLDIQRANMVPMVAKLEGRGLIDRAAVNGRSQGLSLTKAGADIHTAARNIVDAHETYLMARIACEDRAHFLPALAALWQD